MSELYTAEKKPSRDFVNKDSLQWSVIVITRDEELVIGACLQSVTEALHDTAYELIVVDSASVDRTVAFAQEFQARIIRLPKTAPLRPSVGRHVGFLQSRGKWVLFLDGDSILKPSWIESAADALDKEPILGGVAGEMEHISPPGENQHKRFFETYPDSDYQAAEFLSGSAAYKREVLDRAGDFNPFLYSSEEAELGARIRKSGYVLRRLRIPMTSHHYKHSRETAAELIRRIRRGYYVGMGQFVRYANAYDLPLHQPFMTIHRHVSFFCLLMLGIIVAAASIILEHASIFLFWVALMSLIFAAFVLRSRELRKPAYYFLEWTLTSPIVVWGLIKPPRTVDEFPDILKENAP